MLAKQYLIIHRTRNLDIVKPVKVIVRFLLTTFNVFCKHCLRGALYVFLFFCDFCKEIVKMCKKEYVADCLWRFNTLLYIVLQISLKKKVMRVLKTVVPCILLVVLMQWIKSHP